MPCMPIGELLAAAGVTQSEFAEAIGKTQATVSRIINGKVEPGRSFIDAALAFFSKRLNRPVKYEEAFGAPKRKRRAA